MTLFGNKYRTETTRLRTWNYASAGYYFVTICTRNRECFLGEIRDGVVHLSCQGEIAAEEWKKTEIIRDKVRLDAWVIMPNHMHGIVVIEENADHNVETPRRGVSTDNERGVSTNGGLAAGSLGAIIGQFKSVCTKRIRAAGYDFGWQARYYEHIIRNDRSLREIRDYICNNPVKWELDKNNPVNMGG